MNRGNFIVRRLAAARSLGVLALVLLLSACGGGGDSSTPSGDGSLSVTPSSLTFSAEQNGTLPSSQPLNYYSSNSQTYSIYAGYPTGQSVPSWLDMNFSSASSNTLQVSINTTNLAPGTYKTTIRLVSAKIDDTVIDYKDVPVTFYVTSPVTVSANPTSLSFSADEGVAPAAQTVSLSATGGGMPSWTATAQYQGGSTGWLSLTPNTTNNTIQVAVNPLGAGTYNANVVVSYTTAGGNKTLTIPVTYTAASIAVISQSSVAFTAVEGEVPLSQDVTISFGSSNPAWTAQVNYTSGTNWLALSQSGGTLSVQPSAQLPGTYAASIQVTYNIAGVDSTVNIPVSYTVSSGISISQSSLSFTAYEGEDPAASSVNVSYSGAATLTSWSVSTSYSSGSGWLTVTPASGSGLPATLSIDPSPQVAGTYTATLTFNYSFGAISGSKSIDVSYTVSPAVSISQSSLSFNYIEGEDPSPVNLTLNQLGSVPITSWGASVTYSVDNGWLSLSSVNGNSLPVSISVDAIPKTVNTYLATINFTYSVNGITGSLSVPVTYKVNSGISLSPAIVSFSVTEGQTPAPLDIAINYTGTGTIAWTATFTSYYGGASGWLGATQSGTSMPSKITLQPALLTAGNYSATIRLSYVIDGKTLYKYATINYTVAKAWADPIPANIVFNIGATTTISDLTQTVTLNDTYTDGSTITWNASSDVGWLSITPLSGDTNTNNTLSVAIDGTKLTEVIKHPTATVTLTPDNANISKMTIPVSVAFSVPTILNVTPNVRFNGQPSEVIIRGSGFNYIGSATVSFGGQQATSISIISDTEIHATSPSAVFNTNGAYHVTIDGASVLDLSAANLNIVDVPAYSATTISLSGTPRYVIYDPLRKAIFYTTDAGVYKLSYSSGTTWNQTSVTLANARGIALNPDSQSLFVTTHANDFYPEVNPDTLSLGNSISVNNSSQFFEGPAPLNNGTVVLADNSAYGDILLYPSMKYVSVLNQYLNIIYSDNRDVAVYGGDFYGPPKAYDASDGSVSTFSTGSDRVYLTSSAISESAQRILVRNNVYDSTYTALGGLDRTTLPTAVALSPDGTTAYTLTGNLISTYDISGTTGPFPQVGSDAAYTTDTAVIPMGMIISQDGGTLFIYDASTLYVYPIP